MEQAADAPLDAAFAEAEPLPLARFDAVALAALAADFDRLKALRLEKARPDEP